MEEMHNPPHRPSLPRSQFPPPVSVTEAFGEQLVGELSRHLILTQGALMNAKLAVIDDKVLPERMAGLVPLRCLCRRGRAGGDAEGRCHLRTEIRWPRCERGQQIPGTRGETSVPPVMVFAGESLAPPNEEGWTAVVRKERWPGPQMPPIQPQRKESFPRKRQPKSAKKPLTPKELLMQRPDNAAVAHLLLRRRVSAWKRL